MCKNLCIHTMCVYVCLYYLLVCLAFIFFSSLLIFSLPEYFHSISRPEVVGGDQARF